MLSFAVALCISEYNLDQQHENLNGQTELFTCQSREEKPASVYNLCYLFLDRMQERKKETKVQIRILAPYKLISVRLFLSFFSAPPLFF